MQNNQNGEKQEDKPENRFHELLFHTANTNLGSREIEDAVLATFINYPDTYFENADLVSSDSFEARENKEIFHAIQECGNKSKIDILLVREMLLAKGYVQYWLNRPKQFDLLDYVAQICDSINTDEHIDVHIESLCMYTKRRKLASLSSSISQQLSTMKSPDSIISEVSSELVNIQEINDKEEFSINKALSELTAKIESKKIVDGIRSYIVELDNFMYQFDYGSMVVIAGAASMGKTAFAMEIVKRNILMNIPVGVFSLEMGDLSLLARMVSSEGKIPLKNMRTREMSIDDWKVYHSTIRRFEDKHIYIDDESKDLYKIGNRMKKLRIRYGVRFFVIDYLQLVNIYLGPRANREQEIATISRYFKQLAVELDAVVMPLSQITREPGKRTNKEPMLSDLRESGAIEQDANMVIFPFREAYYDPSRLVPEVEDVKIIIAKGRETGTGAINIKFRSAFSKFYSPHEEDSYEEWKKSNNEGNNETPNENGSTPESPSQPGNDDPPF